AYAAKVSRTTRRGSSVQRNWPVLYQAFNSASTKLPNVCGGPRFELPAKRVEVPFPTTTRPERDRKGHFQTPRLPPATATPQVEMALALGDSTSERWEQPDQPRARSPVFRQALGILA